MIISSFVAPSTMGSTNAAPRPDAPAEAAKASGGARPAAIIEISDEAVAAAKTEEFLTARLGDAKANLFADFSPYREDLASLMDQGLTHDEKGENIGQRLAAREWAAYGHHSSYSSKFKAMIEYYDSLSPAEQNSSRYRDMRANAMQMYQAAVEMENGQAENLEGDQNLAVNLFELLELPEPSVERLRAVETAFERMLERLEGSADDGFIKERAVEAGRRFEALMRTVEASAAGDEGALAALTALAEGSTSGAAFTEAAKAS